MMKIHNTVGLNYQVSDLDYYRKMLTKMYCDDSTTPNVIARIVFNRYLTMPFNKRARIEIENENDEAYFQYFYTDYELYAEPLPADTLYLHAHWRRMTPTNGWASSRIQTDGLETQIPNFDGRLTTLFGRRRALASTLAATTPSRTSRARGGAKATT
ncbi:hypothetical protein AtubIFM61612_009459 [Aspergillus tubingensis]|nr:hypothetical protein AtubIFM61612_009459 [Aspergillus tubingensis]